FIDALGEAYTVATAPMNSQIGSGALPVELLPSYGLALRAQPGVRGNPLGLLERRLRALPRPVVGRIADDTLWLDLRCLQQDQLPIFVEQLAQLREKKQA
ncbi:MAG TPA: L-seryl-tRNA(Sec) selenium transferase, partial [Massilia sp.]|nr:L-seryl-tRNA(Sec) selenium transferase [Massilia sp.]